MSQATLAQFRQLVLQDLVLQQRLQNTPDREQFRVLVLQIAHERGYDVALADVDHALRLPKHERFPQPGQPIQPAQLSSWVPLDVYWHHAQLMVDWCYIGNHRFTEPFWNHTIAACLRHPFNRLFRHHTPIDGLAELQAAQPGVPPTGFIFHMSRCGSTLIAQLLATLPQCIVLSEAGPIDTVVRAHQHDPNISDDQRCRWLRGLLSALGQRRHEQEQHLFVKFDSWSIMDLPVIRRAFPDVPWVFVYRDPLEVMVSHRRQRGSQMVPGVVNPRVFGFEPAAIAHLSLDEYCAQALGKICQAAADHLAEGTGRLVPYRHLPDVVWSALLDVFGVEHSAGDVEQMRHATQWHAKNPSVHFANDMAAKQAAATDELRLLAAQWVEPAYARLTVLQQTYGL